MVSVMAHSGAVSLFYLGKGIRASRKSLPSRGGNRIRDREDKMAPFSLKEAFSGVANV